MPPLHVSGKLFDLVETMPHDSILTISRAAGSYLERAAASLAPIFVSFCCSIPADSFLMQDACVL